MAIPIKFVKQQEFVLKVRRDVERIWIARDPVLSQGEIGYDISNNAIKIGNGINSWTNLDYINAQARDIDGRIILDTHLIDFTNPHQVTKDQIGLDQVNNTSDINKPISLSQQSALDTKVNNSQVLTNVPLNALFTDTTYTIGDGQLSEKNFTISLFDKLNNITAIFTTALKGLYDTASEWVIANGTNVLNHLSSTSNPHSVTKSQVGLFNVNNTSDINKPVSTATQTSLDNKVNNSQVLTNVPVGAVFTDTIYNNTSELTNDGADGINPFITSDNLPDPVDITGKADRGNTESTLEEVEIIANAALPAANAAIVATTGDYNDLNNKPDLSAFDNFDTFPTLTDFPATGVSDRFYVAEDTGNIYRWNGTAYSQTNGKLTIGETETTAYRGDRGKIAYDLALTAIQKRTKKVIITTSYQLLPTDVDRFLYFTAATEVTLIVPTGLSEDMEFHYMQRGDGQVNPTAANGMTVNKSASFTKKTNNKYSPAAIRLFSTTEADVFGTLELA